MSAETDILTAVSELAGIKKIGTLGENDTVSMLPSGGRILTAYRNGDKVMQMSVSVHGRGNNQRAIIDNLSSICGIISARAKKLPAGENYRILRAKSAPPTPVTVDGKGNYIYSASVLIDYYWEV